jgi:hypothetical protein
VWEEIERVAADLSVRAHAVARDALGFPRPIEATLDREGLGGVRRATFEGGVLFLETITDWQPERSLSFAIDAQTGSIRRRRSTST